MSRGAAGLTVFPYTTLFRSWAATRTQGGFDIRTFAVKAKPLGAEEGMRPGMSVLVDWDAIE